MILVVDIGNTSITVAANDNNKFTNVVRFSSDKNKTSRDYAEIFKKEFTGVNFSNCIISSVVKELDNIIKEAVSIAFGIKPLFLNDKINAKILSKIEHPQTVGADRIANVLAASSYSLPAIIVDMGTATTFDIVDKEGCLIGGIIIPGVGLQLKSLHKETSLLPLVEVKNPNYAIGTDTETCMLSGVIKGHAHAIEGLLEECESELGENVCTIATGGYAGIIQSNMHKRKFDYVEPYLTLEGIKSAL